MNNIEETVTFDIDGYDAGKFSEHVAVVMTVDNDIDAEKTYKAEIPCNTSLARMYCAIVGALVAPYFFIPVLGWGGVCGITMLAIMAAGIVVIGTDCVQPTLLGRMFLKRRIERAKKILLKQHAKQIGRERFFEENVKSRSDHKVNWTDRTVS